MDGLRSVTIMFQGGIMGTIHVQKPMCKGKPYGIHDDFHDGFSSDDLDSIWGFPARHFGGGTPKKTSSSVDFMENPIFFEGLYFDGGPPMAIRKGHRQGSCEVLNTRKLISNMA